VGSVARIFLSVKSRQPMREVETVVALTDLGLEGSRHQRRGGKRQVLLMDSESLELFALVPGQIKENITTTGLALNDLTARQRLEIGEAVLEVTGRCEPCSRMDEIRMGLRTELQDRRGILCRIIQGGTIRRGDRIKVLVLAGETTQPGAAVPHNFKTGG
jgi:MOSC domain-containing protein YiiM